MRAYDRIHAIVPCGAGGDDLVRETFGSVLHCDGDTLSERIEDLLRRGEDLADVRARERA